MTRAAVGVESESIGRYAAPADAPASAIRWQRTPRCQRDCIDQRPLVHRFRVEQSGLARPVRPRRQTGLCVARRGQRNDDFRFFRFHAGEVRRPVDAQMRCGFRVRQSQQARLPAVQRGGIGERGQNMAHVELAIAERTLAVLPRFTPGDRAVAEPDPGEDGVGGIAPGALLQAVIERLIVMQAIGEIRHALADQPGFGGMQIAGGGMRAQRPATRAVLFPGGNAGAQPQQGSQTGCGEGLRRPGLIELRPGDRRDSDAARQRIPAGALPVTERIRLRLPVQCAGAAGVALQMVFGALVIVQHLGDRIRRGVGIGHVAHGFQVRRR
jgi:hypothetical protein